MDRFDRIFRIHGILKSRRMPISLKQLMEQLECSKSTVERDIRDLRNCLNAPVDYIREVNGYIYNQQSASKTFELPGLWFSAEELHGLLICQQILQNISPGILSKQINSLQDRINLMLNQENNAHPVIANKIQFTTVGRRLKDDSQFKRIATALFGDKQIGMNYIARGQNNKSKRNVSPQKLIYYRDNWYLVAYCHNKNALRMFSVDRVNSAHLLEKKAHKIPALELQDFINSSYGIFTGKAKQYVVLEFSKKRANWVADEQWHPEQKGKWLDNGRYQLSFPYSDSRELIMDILKHGAQVKVITPTSLQVLVKKEIEKMKKIYHCLTD